MNQSTTHDLLAGVARAMPGVGTCVVDAAGEVAWSSDPMLQWPALAGAPPAAGAARHSVTVPLPNGGEIVAVFAPDHHGALEGMLRATLQVAARCEGLERDMASMDRSYVPLLEQLAMLNDTLPKLSAAESDAQIASMGLLACAVATGVCRATYLRLDPESAIAEVLVHIERDAHGVAAVRPYPLTPAVPVTEGLVREVGAGAAVLRRVRAGRGAASPESLAHNEVLGVPVTCDYGNRRVVIGVMLLSDKMESGHNLRAGLRGSDGDDEPQLGSEEKQVAVSFASMLGAVIGARRSAELGKEAKMAQAIQEQLLPASPPRVPGFDLEGACRASGNVGGDYFDYVPLADGRTLAVIADVSGHNLASGMMMVSARATLRTLAAVHADPAQLFRHLGAGMFQDLLGTERFITAAGVALQPRQRVVEIVNAGHNDLLVCRAADGSVQRVSTDDTVFGFLPTAGYGCTSLRLEVGDCLLLYTDGVTEAVDSDGEMFGDERLMAVLSRAASGSARSVIAAVLKAVEQFRRPGGRGDDITVVAIKVVAETKATTGGGS